MSKTFAEIDRTGLYDGIDIDEASIQSIYDWYQYRNVCNDNDDIFKQMFRRKLKLDIVQYNELIRLQFTEFDPLVSSYHESLTETENANTASSEEENANSTTNGSETTRSRTNSETATHTGTVVTDNDTTESNSESSNDDSKSLVRSYPASTVYANAGAGMPANFNWQTASDQEENKIDGTRSGSRTGTNDTTVTNNLSDGRNGTESETVSNDTTVSGSGTKSVTNTESATGETRYISSGRDGLTPQEALKTAMEYVKRSDAFDWLRLELEECFEMVYEV